MIEHRNQVATGNLWQHVDCAAGIVRFLPSPLEGEGGPQDRMRGMQFGSDGASPSHAPRFVGQDASWPTFPSPLEGEGGRRPDEGAKSEIQNPKSKIPARLGFTLIELLMVIIVIGILAGILLVALGRGSTAAQNARIVTEINQLQTACESYRSERGSYPLTVGEFRGETPADQQRRIMRHVAKAFPRYTGDYARMRRDIAIATKPIVGTYPYTIPTSLRFSGGPTEADGGLDINNLDPAEALLFWLGGIPDPTSENKLTGFRLDPASPFYDPNNIGVEPTHMSQQRSRPMFPFDPRRLVDYDNDGWYEYVQPGGSQENQTPPYVYFDSNSYAYGPSYPYAATAFGSAATTRQGIEREDWGTCIPFAGDPPFNPPTVTTLRFANSTTFQLISPGVDNKYSFFLRAYNPANTPWWFVFQNPNPYDNERFPTYMPSGQNLTDQQVDNLTNFARGPIGDEAPAP